MDWGWGLGLEKDEPEGFYGCLNIIQDTLEVTHGHESLPGLRHHNKCGEEQ